MRKKTALEYSVSLTSHFSWIDHWKLHETWENNQSLGLDSNPGLPEHKVYLLTIKTVSSLGCLFRALEPGSFLLHLRSPLKLILKTSIFGRYKPRLPGSVILWRSLAPVNNTRTITVCKRWIFPTRKILENYTVEAVMNWCSSPDMDERLLSARLLASTPGFGVTVGE
jgi:hypothetical protein